ncbi:lantibiotic dehydratase, partial [Pyxidicoccus sp. 3LFB2]
MSQPPSIPAPSGLRDVGFFVLRTPLLPFDELLAWSEGLTAPGAEPSRLEEALAKDRALLRERLRTVLARPEPREALFLASPSLDESYDSWLREPDSEHGQKVERALVRYWYRMAGRSTPFGMFAGCAVGRVGAATRLAVPERHTYKRHARLDMDYVCALADALATLPALRESLVYRPNSSLYRAGGRLRYARSRLNGRTRSYHLVVVEPTDYLEATLTRAHSGAGLLALARGLAESDPDVSVEDALEYVGMLVDHQLLVPDLAPAVTGPGARAGPALPAAPVPALADTHA